MRLLGIFLAGTCLFLLNTPAVSGSSARDLEVVPELDLNRYAGVWYEIARFPNRFQKMCVQDVTATYESLGDGTIRVVNACTNAEGVRKTAEGVARIAASGGPSSKLEVRFAPAFLSFLPFVWGDYWVIDLGPDYSYSVVGNPDRDYLWILSRSPKMENSDYEQILDRLKKQGYDTSRLVKTTQTSNQSQ